MKLRGVASSTSVVAMLESCARIRLSAFVLVAAAAGCSRQGPQPELSVILHIDAPRFYCDKTTVVPLGEDGHDGYRFTCAATGTSLQLDYGDGVGAFRQIVGITTDVQPAREVLLAAQHGQLAARGLPACASATALEGDQNPTLRMDGDHLALGAHPLELAYPCGHTTLVLGLPLHP